MTYVGLPCSVDLLGPFVGGEAIIGVYLAKVLSGAGIIARACSPRDQVQPEQSNCWRLP